MEITIRYDEPTKRTEIEMEDVTDSFCIAAATALCVQACKMPGEEDADVRVKNLFDAVTNLVVNGTLEPVKKKSFRVKDKEKPKPSEKPPKTEKPKEKELDATEQMVHKEKPDDTEITNEDIEEMLGDFPDSENEDPFAGFM